MCNNPCTVLGKNAPNGYTEIHQSILNSYKCYKSAEKNVHKQIKKVKKLFKQNLAKNKTESKRFYSFMKTKTSTHAEVGPLKVGGATITDSKAKPDSLNTYFGSVFQCENPSTLPAATELNSHLKCRGVNFLPSAVKKAIKKLKAKSAPGPESITLSSGVVPEDWRAVMRIRICIIKGGSRSIWRDTNSDPVPGHIW